MQIQFGHIFPPPQHSGRGDTRSAIHSSNSKLVLLVMMGRGVLFCVMVVPEEAGKLGGVSIAAAPGTKSVPCCSPCPGHCFCHSSTHTGLGWGPGGVPALHPVQRHHLCSPSQCFKAKSLEVVSSYEGVQCCPAGICA